MNSRNNIITIMIFFMLLLAINTVVASPKLELSENIFEFGFVPQNSKISHVFWLYNDGDETLKITKVVPGCGCTKAPLQKSEIAPGDSSALEIIFSTRRYKNRVTKQPRIETNEGTPFRSVKIVTNVLSHPDSAFPIVIEPSRLDLSQLGKMGKEEIEFLITNVSEHEIKFDLIVEPTDLVSLQLPNKVAAGKVATAVLKLKPDAFDISFEKSITIELNDKLKSRFTIPIFRTIPEHVTTEGISKGSK